MGGSVPVEYAVAVDRYLDEAELGLASKRVYRISLAGWAWPLVGKALPTGVSRRRASPPVVPLALLDDDDAGQRIAAAVAHRVRHAEIRTVNRELSALRSAIGWWQRRRWINGDPTAALQFPARQALPDRPAAPRPLTQQLTQQQLDALFRARAGLREQAFWHLLADSGVPAEAVLALDAHMVDLRARRAVIPETGTAQWGPRTGELLGWLLAGRRAGPVFLTDRRAPAGTPGADVCLLDGRGRMSYRRAAEIFTQHTRPLDPDGRGWTLHQLRRSPSPDRPAGRPRS
jgi:integrase